MKIFPLLMFIGFTCFAAADKDSDETSAQAKVVVQSALSISKSKDLDFGSAFTGDSAVTISPSNGASFSVTGEPNRQFSILLPTSVTMNTGGGSTSEQILVNSFVSSPSGSATLSAGGIQTVNVGATRAALLPNQSSGDYSVSFTVVVTYQ